MKNIFVSLLILALSAPAFACKGGNQSSLVIRNVTVGTLTKDGKGNGIITLSSNFRPGTVKIAKRIHGREYPVSNLKRSWKFSGDSAAVEIRESDITNEDYYFSVSVTSWKTYRRAGTFRIDVADLYQIARGSGCGGVINGF